MTTILENASGVRITEEDKRHGHHLAVGALCHCGEYLIVAPCSATDCLPELERFAALVAATERTACARHFDVAMRNAVTAEREACAQLVERNAAACRTHSELHDILSANAMAIRARGDA